MIIRDLNGGTLSLTKTQLVERKGGIGKYYLNLKDLRDGQAVRIRQVPGKSFDKTLLSALTVVPHYKAHWGREWHWTIGCRKFIKEVYDQIIAAAEKARASKKVERKSGKSK